MSFSQEASVVKVLVKAVYGIDVPFQTDPVRLLNGWRRATEEVNLEARPALFGLSYDQLKNLSEFYDEQIYAAHVDFNDGHVDRIPDNIIVYNKPRAYGVDVISVYYEDCTCCTVYVHKLTRTVNILFDSVDSLNEFSANYCS